MDLTALKKTLESHHFKVSLFPNKEDAAKYLEESLKGETIGFGGSATLEEMGLYERMGKNNTVIWHWKNPADRTRYPEFTAYFTSANAIAETGEMINIDGAGNRVSASIYGPKKIYFIIGRNKVTPDLASAVKRARDIPSPLNAKRLGKKTPCVTDLKCHDCNSPERICGVMSIHMRPVHGPEHTEIVLIDEDLGY